MIGYWPSQLQLRRWAFEASTIHPMVTPRTSRVGISERERVAGDGARSADLPQTEVVLRQVRHTYKAQVEAGDGQQEAKALEHGAGESEQVSIEEDLPKFEINGQSHDQSPHEINKRSGNRRHRGAERKGREEIVYRRTEALRLHPDSRVIPRMTHEEYSSLKASVAKSGVLEPLSTLRNGYILDGRHRWDAAVELRIKRVPCRIVTLRGRQTALDLIVSAAAQRRNLSTGQKAAMGVDLAVYFEARATAAAKQKTTQIRSGQPPKVTPAVADAPRPVGQKSRDVAAKMVGVSGRSIQDALKIKNTDADLFARLKSGKVSLNEAMEEIKQRQDESPSTKTPGAGGRKTTGRVSAKRSIGPRSPTNTEAGGESLLDRTAQAGEAFRRLLRQADQAARKDATALGVLRGAAQRVTKFKTIGRESAQFAAVLAKLLKWGVKRSKGKGGSAKPAKTGRGRP
ncbi:MAG: ParB N-terminal domain-containing protein [Acidobacteria bacterium]|nr:ParB N-terminal domain-containing protein [Acidobacteriota bacterium]